MTPDERLASIESAVDTALPGVRRLATRLASWAQSAEMWIAPQQVKRRVRAFSRALLQAGAAGGALREVTIPPGSPYRYEAMREAYPEAQLKQDAAFNRRVTPLGVWLWTRWADAVDEASSEDGVLVLVTPSGTAYRVRYDER